MTIQQLKYAVTVAEIGSITEAAKTLYISQPSMTNAIRNLETEIEMQIFVRTRTGIALTPNGMEFLGYARQVLSHMELLEDRFISCVPPKTEFRVSAQHYKFAEDAFVDLVKEIGQERYEFWLNETGTHQVMEDVKNRISEMGIIYLSDSNRVFLQRILEEYHLTFHHLFYTDVHVFVRNSHPLAGNKKITLKDLEPYPRLNFVQGNFESSYYSEEMYSTVQTDKEIRVNDRGAIINFMFGLDAYTITSGIFPKYLSGDELIAIPLVESGEMQIGYILNDKQELSETGKLYISKLICYAPHIA